MSKTILQINVDLNSGSTGRIVEDIGKMLIARGDKSFAAYGDDFTNSVSVPVKIGSRTEFNIHALQTRLFDNHGSGSFFATKRFIKKIAEINPDIIHLHNIHGYYLNIHVLFEFLRQYGKPIVWTFHDCWPFTGHCAFFNSVNCEKWKTGCYQCPLKNNYPKSLFVDNSKNNYRIKKNLFTKIENLTLTTVSEWSAAIIKESFMGMYPIHVIHNGIDVNIFSDKNRNNIRNKYKIGNRFFILGVASYWGERKGLNDFYDLSKRIDDNSVIVLVGLNNKQIQELPNKITGISTIKDINELSGFYAAADVFVNPSRAETFGMVTAEALACGTPVVAYNNTANPELTGNKEGFLVQDGNIDKLYKSIKIAQKNGRAFYTANCRKKALSHFDKNQNYSRYLEIYDNLM